LKSLKDPYGQQINYGFDKVGWLNNVFRSTPFAGITNYADTPSYNARGVLKGLHYGNGVEMNITNFNEKMQATNFEVKKRHDWNSDTLVCTDAKAFEESLGKMQLEFSQTPSDCGRNLADKSVRVPVAGWQPAFRVLEITWWNHISQIATTNCKRQTLK
jgi:hypothetical protein